ncbi:alpha-ketoacid dehydrogenase subunit alpha/beta [Amycolatopsis jejuensis]|uniref:alpha-ketoacid dehydrogenase subunit alpha/beta n=1 Tax=Amycolatopsis jejuensis TaxID=330084 RepID=UPI0005259A29|nr:alpha-ketoacid dehydrogenase subunit alpha/beta [Amycolatopsis jejuensis]
MTDVVPQLGARADLGEEVRLDLYRRVVLARAFDEQVRRGLWAGRLRFNYWPSEGHEAIAAGAWSTLRPGDRAVVTYRGGADAIALGVPVTAVVAEYLGRVGGTSGGRGGAMGLCDPERNLALSTGIVGAGAPIANGIALAATLRGSDSVTVVSFGDGATSIGFVHEAMNLAALWKLPVVFLCQNNQFGEHTPIGEYTLTKRLSDRAPGYGMPGVTVDGFDPEAVHRAAGEAVARARAGEGPTFLEATCYRLQGHSFGAPMPYADPDELAAAKAAEPVGAYRTRLIEAGVSADALGVIEAEVTDLVATSIEAALQSPQPDLAELGNHVLAGTTAATPESPAGLADPGLPDSPRTKTGMSGAVNDALAIALETDARVFLLGEDIADPAGGTFKITKGLSDRFGTHRVRATPISETAIVGAAIGAAMQGLRPVAELMFADFLPTALDQIANHAAKLRSMTGGQATVPLTIRTLVGSGTGAQHSQSLETLVAHIPGLKVVYPSTAADAKGLLAACIADDDPCVFFESAALLYKPGEGEVPQGPYEVPIGTAAIRRPGKDATVVAYGTAVPTALLAAEELAGEIDVEVIDLRSLVPWDSPRVFASARRTGRAVVTYPAVQFAGFGAEVAARISEECHDALRAPVRRAGGAYTAISHAPNLSAAFYPSVSKLVEILRSAMAF